MPPKKADDRKGGEETLTRIAIVSEDKCVQKFQIVLDLKLMRLSSASFSVRPRSQAAGNFTCAPLGADASPRSAGKSARKAALSLKLVSSAGAAGDLPAPTFNTLQPG
jgi:hypothetical protein